MNFEELARSTEDFNGAMLKAVCVEAGMLAMRRDASCITHEDFVEGVAQVQMKKKQNLQVRAWPCCASRLGWRCLVRCLWSCHGCGHCCCRCCRWLCSTTRRVHVDGSVEVGNEVENT